MKFGIPIEHAQRIDRIINKQEYEKELFLRNQLQTVIEEAEAVFTTLKEMDLGDPKVLKVARQDVQIAMEACVTNFERFM